MKLPHRIWDDVRKGENIDQYLTIVAALALTVLNLLGLSTQAYLAPFTLAVLALLAISGLGNRYKLDEILNKKSESIDNFFVENFPATYDSDFENSSVMWLFGVSLRRTIQGKYEILEKKLRQGHQLRVLLINPSGAGIEMAVARNYADRTVEPKQTEISYILKLLCNLQKTAPRSVEVRVTNFPLAYGAMAINPNAVTGKLYIEHYGYRVSTDSIPRYVLKISDGRWYEFHKKELEALWSDGIEWGCEETQPG